MMLGSSSAFLPASYHPMAAGYVLRAASPIWLIIDCFVFPWLSLLTSCRLFDLTDGTRGGTAGLLGYRGVAHHVSSMGVYNEYDVCDV